MKDQASFFPVKFRGERVNKRCLASAVCDVVEEVLLHNGGVRNKMSRKSHQQKVAAMPGAPLKGC